MGVLKPIGRFVTSNMYRDWATKYMLHEVWQQVRTTLAWFLGLRPRYRFAEHMEMEMFAPKGCWAKCIAEFASAAAEGTVKFPGLVEFPKAKVHEGFAALKKGGAGKIAVVFDSKSD